MSEPMSEPWPESQEWRDRGDADLTAPRETRWLVVALVAMIHVSVILGLVRAFAPDFTAKVAEQVLSTFTVTVTTSPTPKPPPPPKEPEKAGKAAEIGKKAVPREAAAPKARIALATQAAPPVAGRGSANSAGAGDAGQGTGAGGQGSGTGSGNGGAGQGGGGIAAKAVKIAGDISSARDYPRESRDLRIGELGHGRADRRRRRAGQELPCPPRQQRSRSRSHHLPPRRRAVSLQAGDGWAGQSGGNRSMAGSSAGSIQGKISCKFTAGSLSSDA